MIFGSGASHRVAAAQAYAAARLETLQRFFTPHEEHMGPYFDQAIYRARREQLGNGLEDTVLVVAASVEQHKTNDLIFPYRASNDVVYLTGLDEPECVAVLRPGCEERGLTLFVRPRDPKREQWDGFRTGVEGAKALYGADLAFPIESLEEELPELIRGRNTLGYSLNVDPALDRRVFAALDKLKGGRGKANRVPERFLDPRRRLHNMRLIKSDVEAAVLREAADITVEAHIDAMKTVRPGMSEFAVAARLDYLFRRRGAAGPGYESIVGGGANATILHYVENRDDLVDGTLLLIDAGAELHYYNSDITRTFPVGAAFSGPQRDLYDAVLAVQKAAIDKCVVGASAHELNLWSRRAMTQAMLDLGLLEGDLDQLVEDEGYAPYYMHGLGHYLGMDVHDVGDYFEGDDVPVPMEAGVVLTIEPGIYINADAEGASEHFRGIGIRIEDDVLITASGPEVLTAGVPKDIDDIEALRREALGKSFPTK